ncbi:MAG: hypothetical protein KKG33_09870 [candidate division Zixibacteria bacterium]|nr:hypothetical protein [candidate division Zixibacteria bacterium]
MLVNSSLPFNTLLTTSISLEAALWAFYYSESFKEGLLLAVNLGNDTQTPTLCS